MNPEHPESDLKTQRFRWSGLFGQPESQEAINRIVKSFFIVLLLLTGFGEVAMGNLLDSDIAIKGYDTVAYFTTGKALKGNESFTFKWHDMTWYFLTKENRDLFATNPE
ncbi:MAG: hypothetical protein H6R42_400, partial [Nitrospirae bacterium]|nr:hypothetical protein [Nitrospirota bacterium]